VPNAKTLWSLSGLFSPKKVLEVTVFGEHIAKGLVHDFVGGRLQEGSILIDLYCG